MSEVELRVEGLIYQIRGEKVILDQDLASLYGVETKALVQAVKRNPERFPTDFMFQLSNQEFRALRSQIVTSNSRQDGGAAKREFRNSPIYTTNPSIIPYPP